jgi:hypothetical protein
MAKGYFIRTDPSPFKIRFDLNEPVKVIKQGDVIYVEYQTYKDVVGFTFIGWSPPKNTDISQDPLRPTTLYEGEEIDVVGVQAVRQAPHKIFLENKKKQEQSESKPTQIKFQEDNTSAVKPPELPAANLSEEELEGDALIAYLKKFGQKNWFIMKKEKAKEYMERLKVDYSSQPDNKTELIRHLKSFIDNQPD